MTAHTLTFTNPETGTYQVPVTVPAARYCYGHGGLHSGPDGLCMECQRRAAQARRPACHKPNCPGTRTTCMELMR